MEYRAALLASHGFAALALDYLTPQITRETGKMVDNDYFEVDPIYNPFRWYMEDFRMKGPDTTSYQTFYPTFSQLFFVGVVFSFTTD